MKRTLSTLSILAFLAAAPLSVMAANPEKPVSGSTSNRESAGEYIDDAAITAKVKAAFVKDDSVKATQIKVETFKGLVQLSGFADNPAAIDRAVQVAKGVPGVKEVKNDIRLK